MAKYQAIDQDQETVGDRTTVQGVVRLAHGSGGRVSAEFIQHKVAPLFPDLHSHRDSAVIQTSAADLAFTTDSFVIDPLFFPGGDIGRLSVCGTVNDLAVQGARPAWLSLALVIAEGLPMKTVLKILDSVAKTAREVGVKVVTGDTKVVERGAVDGLFVNTAGIGEILPNATLGLERLAPGDEIIVSGDVGAHEMAVLGHRHNLGFNQIVSDCGPVNEVAASLINEFGSDVKWMRDPTRGGLATVLNELASLTRAVIDVEETKIPIKESVLNATEVLGLDPLYLACEGRLVAILEKGRGEAAVKLIRKLPEGTESAVIGSITEIKAKRPQVQLHTKFNSRRVLRYLAADQQPRIC